MNDYRKVWLKCNVNDAVKFTLGPRGKTALLNEYGKSYLDTVHPGWDKDGTKIQMQLWEFMRVLGPITHMGVCDDYGTNIELEVYLANAKGAVDKEVATSGIPVRPSMDSTT